MVKVHISRVKKDSLTIRLKAEGTGGMLGDVAQEVKPGAVLGDTSFDDLKALGPGEHDIPNEKLAT